MENEIVDIASGRKNNINVLIAFIIAFVIYFTIMSLFAPIRKLKEIKKEYGVKTDTNNLNSERIYTDSLYLKLLKDKAYLQSRVLMAETDSIYLTINLPDSTANIEISGLVVHKANISNMQVSKILMTGDESCIVSMFALPLKISKASSTIKKEPLMIKMAPKDTSDYKPDIMPDTSAIEPVNFVFYMADGTKIYVYQDENNKLTDKIRKFTFDLIDRFRTTGNSLFNILIFRVPEYHPFIKIWLPGADAKIIYRALPEEAQLGILL